MESIGHGFQHVLLFFGKVEVSYHTVKELTGGTSQRHQCHIGLGSLLADDLCGNSHLSRTGIGHEPLFLIFGQTFFLGFQVSFIAILQRFIHHIAGILQAVQ